MSVKAIYLEIVLDLTTIGFLKAIKRFVARRGLPSRIFSDNGTNFKGAKNDLNELFQLLQSDEFHSKLSIFCQNNGIEWHFIPPKAPNFGGLWEAAVKSFKKHFKSVGSNQLLTYEEFETLSLEIEAILNSRPLTLTSDDANDLEALTPGHFLIVKSLKDIPEQNLQKTPNNRLSVYQSISKFKQEFWTRWHNEYLNNLTNRRNQRVSDTSLAKDILVIIKNDQLPSMKWKLGRITEIHPGKDGVVRVVTVKTPTGLLKRPSSKIAVLPLRDNREIEEENERSKNTV